MCKHLRTDIRADGRRKNPPPLPFRNARNNGELRAYYVGDVNGPDLTVGPWDSLNDDCRAQLVLGTREYVWYMEENRSARLNCADLRISGDWEWFQ